MPCFLLSWMTVKWTKTVKHSSAASCNLMPSGFTTPGGHDPPSYDLKTMPSNAIFNCVHASVRFHTDEDRFAFGSPGFNSSGLNQCWHNLDWTLVNKFQWNFDEIERFEYKRMYFNVSSAKCQPFCLGLNMLITFIHPQNSILMKIASPRTCWLQPVTCWIVYENMAKQFMFLPFREAELA